MEPERSQSLGPWEVSTDSRPGPAAPSKVETRQSRARARGSRGTRDWPHGGWSVAPSLPPGSQRRVLLTHPALPVLPPRPRVPEEKDSAERPGPSAEPGGDHVQPARVPGDSQVSCRGGTPSAIPSCLPCWTQGPGCLQTPPGYRGQPVRGHPCRKRRHRRLLKRRWFLSGVCLCLRVGFHSAHGVGKPWSGGWVRSQPKTQRVTFEALSLLRVLPSFVTGSLNAFFSRFQSPLHRGSTAWRPPGAFSLCDEVPSCL